MNHRIVLCALLSVPLSVGCFQELNPSAATGGPSAVSDAPENSTALTYADDAGHCPDGMVTGGSDGVSRFGVCIPADPNTPPIELVSDDDGATTMSPCAATEMQSMQVRTNNCAFCHSPGQAELVPGMNLLDDSTLINAPSTKPGLTLIVPGKPDDSYIYERAYLGLDENNQGGMPPPGRHPRPSVSDVSIIRTWILCMSDAGAAGDNTFIPGPGSSAPPASGGDAGAAPVSDAGGGGG